MAETTVNPRQESLVLRYLPRIGTRQSRDGHGVRIILALVLVAACPALAGERVSEATPGLEWEFWHDQLAACQRADRIAAECARAHCDEEALRRAQRG